MEILGTGVGEIRKILGTNALGTVNVTHAVIRRFLIPMGRGTFLIVSSDDGVGGAAAGVWYFNLDGG